MQRRILILNFIHNIFTFVTQKVVICVILVLLEEFEDTKRGNQNPQIEEEQTIQWPREKVQRTNKDLQNIHIKLKIE